ncbi:MAG: PQQ-dependent sugar dehydrogenase [Rhodothermaceae bacterium]|nr:PQQ-dependent sugar dehydrogenase [Rhodothermaceae bacterium]
MLNRLISPYLVMFAVVCSVSITACAQEDPYYGLYVKECATCHGDGFQGTGQGPALAQPLPIEQGSLDQIIMAIKNGAVEKGMPAFGQALSPLEIKRLAILISEVRMTGVKGNDYYNVQQTFSIPSDPIQTEKHAFRIESVATGIDPLPYSIAPLPDGRILVTEKMRGLRIVNTDGSLSPLIDGTPQTYDHSYQMPGVFLKYGNGWMLDVTLHPDYEENGWIYMTFGDRCMQCNYISRMSASAVSMLKLVRGRIADGVWVEQETLWESDSTTYTPMADMTLGGRMTFDDAGHLFFSLGMKGVSNFSDIQDLDRPSGKIHRIYDDGSIPEDNPYVNHPEAVPSIWSYGHRSPQGLEFNPRTGKLWGTEMGPRGGDEVNLIMPGKNYGWPLYSKGLNYDGTPVEYGKQLGIELDLSTIEQTKIDLTPSPAISSFVIHDGSVFPEWKDNLIVGSLKATELFRMVIDGEDIVHTETIIKDFARIRDVEHGPDGTIYLLLEHADGGQIVKLVKD